MHGRGSGGGGFAGGQGDRGEGFAGGERDGFGEDVTGTFAYPEAFGPELRLRGVVMHQGQLAFAEDQGPVQQLAAEGQFACVNRTAPRTREVGIRPFLDSGFM
jgi:hypothetical protein